jgi:hypothetical protein
VVDPHRFVIRVRGETVCKSDWVGPAATMEEVLERKGELVRGFPSGLRERKA